VPQKDNEMPDSIGLTSCRLDDPRFTAANRERLSGPAVRTFLTIAAQWSLTDDQRRLALGNPPTSTYVEWSDRAVQMQSQTLSVDVLMRISAILGIYADLHVIFSDEQQALRWLRMPNAAALFAGRCPLDCVTSGIFDELLTMRKFLADVASGNLSSPPGVIEAETRS
jgi:hypothetical protein